MKYTLIILTFMFRQTFAQNVIEHVPPDYVYDTVEHKFVPFEPEVEYDCYQESAKDILFLLREYVKYCRKDSVLIGYENGRAIMPVDNDPHKSYSNPVYIYTEASLTGFMLWLETFTNTKQQ